MKQPSRGEDDEAGREKKREASTGVMLLGKCLVNFCSSNIYMLFSGSVNQSALIAAPSRPHLESIFSDKFRDLGFF